MRKNFLEISRFNNFSPDCQSNRDAQITLKFESGKFEAYSTKFPLKEFMEALCSAEAAAPGEDTFLYERLKFA